MFETSCNLFYLRLQLQQFKHDFLSMSALRRLVHQRCFLDVSRLNDDAVIEQAAHLLTYDTFLRADPSFGVDPTKPVQGSRASARVIPVGSQGADVVYFDRQPQMDPVEFERALKMAEDEINQLAPERFLDRLNTLESSGARVLRDKAAQARSRKTAIRQYKGAMAFLFEMLREEYPQFTPKEAAASLAREVGGSRFGNLHIEHRLDIGGGGRSDKFAGLGDASINSYIGTQWAERIPLLKRFAEEASKRKQRTMDIRFCIRN